MPKADLPDCSQRLRREAEDELPLIEHELKVLDEVVSWIDWYIANANLFPNTPDCEHDKEPATSSGKCICASNLMPSVFFSLILFPIEMVPIIANWLSNKKQFWIMYVGGVLSPSVINNPGSLKGSSSAALRSYCKGTLASRSQN
jgi:hypothetical protein